MARHLIRRLRRHLLPLEKAKGMTPHPSLAMLVPPVSLRLGHISALALSMQFTTEMPLHYPLEKAAGGGSSSQVAE